MLTCPNCGGAVHFDIASQKLKCESCQTIFEPQSFEGNGNAEESEEFQVTTFRCPQCGGEIYSTDDTAAGFCSYCGASVVLESRMEKKFRPEYVIPFKKTKQDCKESFRKVAGKSLFLPAEYKNEKKIDGFRGIYMPYWVYDVRHTGSFSLRGVREYREGNYICKDYMICTGEADASYSGISYDASREFGDDISSSIAPYYTGDILYFSPVYLSGFYADTGDMPMEAYSGEAADFANARGAEYLQARTRLGTAVVNKSPEKLREAFHTELRGHRALFPVWFMSWRDGDRVAYATVNGETGKVAADLPVSVSKFLTVCVIVAIPIFFLLNLFLTMIPRNLTGFTALLAFIAELTFLGELGAIRNREKGKKAAGGTGSSPGTAAWIIVGIVVLFFLFGFLGSSSLSKLLGRGSTALVIFIFAFVAAVVCRNNYKDLGAVHGVYGTWLAAAACGISAGVLLLNPVSDIPYYLTVILSLAATAGCLVDVIRKYNILATRPLPQFASHRGGDDRG